MEVLNETEQTNYRMPEVALNRISCSTCGSGQVSEFLSAPDRFHLRTDIYRLDRCSTCGTVWQADPPSPAHMALHYTEDYHRAIMAAGEGSAAERWKEQVKLIAKYKSGGKVLDTGCSSGGFLSTMKGPNWQLYGIEMEGSTAERARANTGAEVFVGDVVDAPYLRESFDVITCFDVLEHVYSPRQFLSKVKEWLKPGGLYYAMMPNIDSWEAKLFGSYWFGLELPRHITHFSPRSLRHLLTKMGFEEIIVKTPVVSYIERSAGYVGSKTMERLGFSPTSQAQAGPRGLAEKAVRKGLRTAFIGPFAHVASMAGAGPCVEVVFRKTEGR
jgi:2-polyprenyl-3-methyl-5-hydroxy-6-metoxy-1,4-benzoquinol methylase